MLRETARAHANGGRARAVRVVEPESPMEPAADAPLLHGRTIAVDPKPLVRFAQRLVKVAPDGAGVREFRMGAETVCALIEATIRGSVEAGGLRSLGELLAALVLRSCAEALAARVPQHWPHGYCPVCGAWPALAELRGMDRARRLRCGRCAGDWQMVWLRCAYCGEAEHAKLARLAPEGSLESRFVEACATCRRYLKCTSTLTPLTQMELLLRDLETVELDIAALDRGYRRPDAPAFPVHVRVLA
jgi:FdhE protein